MSDTSTPIPQILVDGYHRGCNTDPHIVSAQVSVSGGPTPTEGISNPAGNQDDVAGDRWKIEKELDVLIGVYGVKSVLIP
jgi:hypothetical protein